MRKKRSGDSRKEEVWLPSHGPAAAQQLPPYPAAAPRSGAPPPARPSRTHPITFLADAGAVHRGAGDGVLAGAARGAVDSVSVRRTEAGAVRALEAAGGPVSGGSSAPPAPHPPAAPGSGCGSSSRGAPHRVAGRAPAEAAVGLAEAAVQAEAVLPAARPVRVPRAALVAVKAGPARLARALPAHRVAAAGEAGGALGAGASGPLGGGWGNSPRCQGRGP